MLNKIDYTETVNFLKEKAPAGADIGLILGSGLGALANEIEAPVVIPYRDIPNFPVSTVEGHAGQLVVGRLEGKRVVAMQGRFHYYEGYPLQQVVFPVRVMSKLGIGFLVVTNAAGGINHGYEPGDLMLIRDHLNLTGTNPLIGPNDDGFGPRFPDMSEAYDRSLMETAEKVALGNKLKLQKGVYAGLTGPTYETPAEIKYLRSIGADAVGMSTVPEVIVANHAGIRVLGISCITNMAAGVLPQKLTHEEVMETAERVREKFTRLVKGVLREVSL
jgi:purine-nucleoside phosphorylase